MTINDMLESGITLQGYIEVRQYDPEKDERFTAFSRWEDNGLMCRIDEPWADLPVGYIYCAYGSDTLTIEVG